MDRSYNFLANFISVKSSLNRKFYTHQTTILFIMIDTSMSKKELEEFLSKPLIARIATIGKDNMPNIHPVWFLYENGIIFISTGRDSAKVRNIKRNPKVAVTVDVSEDGVNKGVVFRGEAELVENDELSKRILLKYLGPDNPKFKQLVQIPRIVVKVKPEKMFSWDSSKIFG